MHSTSKKVIWLAMQFFCRYRADKYSRGKPVLGKQCTKNHVIQSLADLKGEGPKFWVYLVTLQIT